MQESKPVAFAALLGLAAPTAVAEEWYVGAGAGVNWTSEMNQAGWNRDTTCYPDNDCGRIGGAPEGYRWFYDLESDPGAVFEISIGRRFGNARLELSATQRNNDIEQKFTGITYLDGSAPVPKVGNHESSIEASIDEIETRTLALNVYYDFPLSGLAIAPYLGAGLGLSLVDVSGVHLDIRYSCKDPAPDCADVARFNSGQDVDLSDTVLSKHLYAGADYPLSDRIVAGLKASYSMVDDIKDWNSYSHHPLPELKNLNEVRGIDQWSLMMGVKYRFGGP